MLTAILSLCCLMTEQNGDGDDDNNGGCGDDDGDEKEGAKSHVDSNPFALLSDD